MSHPTDPAEREADHAAAEVMRAPNDRGRPMLASRPHGVQIARNEAGPPIGRRLEPTVRADMEARFGTSFEPVRIHEGSDASHAAESVDAKAFTVGQDIVFGRGQYDPVSDPGRRLLAHELAHTLQDTGAGHVIRRQPRTGGVAPKTEPSPQPEPGELQESAKAKLAMEERIPRHEWLIYGFPIGRTDISAAESGGFIATIVKSLMQGYFFYKIGQDPLDVLGFSDSFSGPHVDNHGLRQLRAANF